MATATTIAMAAACSHAATGPTRPTLSSGGETVLRVTGQPLPPMQLEPWTPVAGDFAPDVIAAVRDIFDRGLADPRGLPYRDIELVIDHDDVVGDGEVVQTQGWVFDHDQWAIAWNGLVYPVRTVGAVATLPETFDGDFVFAAMAFSERTAVDSTSPTALKVALLLRLGRPAAALSAWEAGRSADDLYEDLAVGWVWSLLARATSAHLRGDDAIAHASTRLLTAIVEPLRAELRARRRPDDRLGDFTDAIAALARDQDRRAARPLVLPDLTHRGFVALSESEQVTMLIDWLDQVAARVTDVPGGLELKRDPIVAALIAIGPAAVDPLLAVLDHDARLTRSVGCSIIEPGCRMATVGDAAFAALDGILNLTASGAKASTAGQIRQLLALRTVTRKADRWYRDLADDAASPAVWAVAAESIARPVGADVWFRTALTTAIVLDPEELAGEVLRARTGPSVTELMIRRAGAAGRDPAAGCMIAEALVGWDRRFPVDVIADATKAAIARTDQAGAACVVDLTTARVRRGDYAAVADYLGWLEQRDPRREDDDSFVLDPLIAHIDDPQVVAVADRMFADGSKWRPTWQRHHELINRRALVVSEIADAVVAGLGDTSVVARVTADDEMVSVEPRGGEAYGFARDDGMTGAIDQSVRACDLVAEALAAEIGAPAFSLTWPESKRDAGVAAMITWVGKVR